MWLAFTLEELGEVSRAMQNFKFHRGSIDDIIEEAIQTATLTLKIADKYLDLKKLLERIK